jgi:hypothetical protein
MTNQINIVKYGSIPAIGNANQAVITSPKYSAIPAINSINRKYYLALHAVDTTNQIM